LAVSPTPIEAQPREIAYPSAQALGEFHFQRNDRPTFARLNTGNHEHNQNIPMYTFQSGRSPISPMISEISPATSVGSHHLAAPGVNNKNRNTKKEPCPRPAAKRMRDTRDREGKTLKDLEDELEFEGRLGGAKRLNANNKDESGRRFSRADILEAEYESRRQYTGRNKDLLQVLQKVNTCTSPTSFAEIKKEVAALLMSEQTGAPYPGQQPRHYDSGYSEASDYERRSPSSGEWSAVGEDAGSSYARGSIRQ
jgi:hypothetical protein